MYDDILPPAEAHKRLYSIALKKAKNLLSLDPAFVEERGGESAVASSILSNLGSARDALTIPPRDRLAQTLSLWAALLEKRLNNPEEEYLSDLEDGDPEYEFLADQILLSHILEIESSLEQGDVNGAFSLLRNLSEAPYREIVPEILDITSMYWVDLEEPN